MASINPEYPKIHTLLFFGSFDPVTLGHEAVIAAGLDLVNPQQLWLVPAYLEGWGKRLSSFADRAAMIKLLSESHPDWRNKVQVASVEKDQKLSGITAETLHYLLGHGAKQLGFLMGADWIVSFPTWEEWEWMLTVAPAFVALRGRETEASVTAKLPEAAKERLGKQIFFLPEDRIRETKLVSSTEVRAHFRENNHSDLVAPAVGSYIRANHLYQSG